MTDLRAEAERIADDERAVIVEIVDEEGRPASAYERIYAAGKRAGMRAALDAAMADCYNERKGIRYVAGSGTIVERIRKLREGLD